MNYGLIFEDTISSKVTEEIVLTLQLDKKKQTTWVNNFICINFK